MKPDKPLDAFVSKQVKFRFHGWTLQFCLSRSLRGSHDVDEATRRLLASLSKHADLAQARSLLNTDCGLGVLGISLKRAFPEMSITLQDKDALALAFTRLNARLNNVSGLILQPDLSLANLGMARFDLIVSSLPGSAGTPVLQDMVSRVPFYLTDRGRAVVAIIAPLAEMVESTIMENRFEILLAEVSNRHAIFHFRPPLSLVADAVRNGGQQRVGASQEPLSAYARGEPHFVVADIPFSLQTVYGLAEFDTASFQTSLAASALKNQTLSGRVLFWNPGQGHLPVFTAEKDKGKAQISNYVLGGRDLLALMTARFNLIRAGVDPELIELLHLPHILDATGQYDGIILFPDIDPGVPWEKLLMEKCLQLLQPGGRLLLTSKSAFVQRLLASPGAPQPRISKKRHGLRSILLKKG